MCLCKLLTRLIIRHQETMISPEIPHETEARIHTDHHPANWQSFWNRWSGNDVEVSSSLFCGTRLSFVSHSVSGYGDFIAFEGCEDFRYAVALSADSIVVTTGSSAAFVLSFLSAFEAGDRVAIGTPGYPCYRNILEALGVTVVRNAFQSTFVFWCVCLLLYIQHLV